MIIGNLTRDPELRTTNSGQSVTSFGVATNRVWTDQSGQKQEKAEFHNVVAWGKLAEICNQYLGKGRRVFIEGRLQTRDWEGQDGVKRTRTEVIAENMIMLDRSPGQGGQAGNYNRQPAQQPAPQAQSEPAMAEASADSDAEIKVEDIPF